jgi:hypothetical protein
VYDKPLASGVQQLVLDNKVTKITNKVTFAMFLCLAINGKVQTNCDYREMSVLEAVRNFLTKRKRAYRVFAATRNKKKIELGRFTNGK